MIPTTSRRAARSPGGCTASAAVGLLYGQRALLIGALEPLTYTGTMLSTRAADQPFQRLARTAKIQETVLLGTREEADKALGGRPPTTREGQRHAARGRGRPPRRHPLLGLRPGADAVDAGGDRRLGPGDVRGDGAAADRRRARGPLAGLRPLRRALRAACQRGSRQLPRVQRLVGGAAGLTGPTGNRARAWRWHRWSPSSSRCRRRPAATSIAQNHIIKGTLPPRVREIFGIRWSRTHETRISGDDRSPPPRPALYPRAAFAAAATTYFFDVVTKSEHQRGGTRTPQLRVSP